jgi:GT2 family glycosyltransferase
MENNIDCGIIVPKIIFPDSTFHSAGTFVFGKKGIIERGHQKKDVGQYDNIEEVDTALGCCTIFKRDVCLKVEGADENYNPCWVEDWDFGMSVRKAGFKIIYFPKVKIIHYASGFRKPRFENMVGLDSKTILLRKLGIFFIVRALYRLTIKNLPGMKKPSFFEVTIEKHFKYWEKKWGFDPNDSPLVKIKYKKIFYKNLQ